MIKIILKYIFSFFIFSTLWVILNEELSIYNIILGGLLGLLSIYLTSKFVMNKNYIDVYNINFLKLFRYILFIIPNIYLSGFKLIVKIFKGNSKPHIIKTKTKLENELYGNILANSITLTPGTVSVFKRGEKINILSFTDNVENNERSVNAFIKKIEKIFEERK